jgi:hypothetical protein
MAPRSLLQIDEFVIAYMNPRESGARTFVSLGSSRFSSGLAFTHSN